MSRLSVKQNIGLLLAALVLSPTSFAETGQLDTGNTAWILVATALVLFMSLPGLALFYGGLVRSKNVLSVLMQCFSIAGVASLIWFVVGYSLSFTGDGAFIGSFAKSLLMGVQEGTLTGDIPETVFMVFQMAFAIITPALIIGAFAERMRFSAVLLFSAFWVLLVYIPVCHWVWGGGWLAQLGLLDFAGGTVVHVTAGVAALVAALVVGNRQGFGTTPMPPHNLTMTVTGAGMLWVGWFGFNAGSALAADGNAGMALLATHLSASAGALTWMTIEWIKYGKPSALGIVTGMVAGLGTITPASGFVGPSAAIVIGTVAGVVCFYATLYLKNKLKIDDSLDVFPVHGVGGIIGTLMVGVFASNQLGIFSGQGLADGVSIIHQVAVQMLGILATGLYTAIITYVLLKVIDLIVGLRVTAEEEAQGLDIILHNESGYDL